MTRVGVIQPEAATVAGGDVAVGIAEKEDVLLTNDKGIADVLDARWFALRQEILPSGWPFGAASRLLAGQCPLPVSN
jgi:hypothetical protein